VSDGRRAVPPEGLRVLERQWCSHMPRQARPPCATLKPLQVQPEQPPQRRWYWRREKGSRHRDTGEQGHAQHREDANGEQRQRNTWCASRHAFLAFHSLPLTEYGAVCKLLVTRDTAARLATATPIPAATATVISTTAASASVSTTTVHAVLALASALLCRC
jgi:hypothetical protein